MRPKKKIFIVLFPILICSCQPVLKLITGVRNPQIKQCNKERLEYYHEWIKNKQAHIYTLDSKEGFIKLLIL
jgi:hypothetical protein